MNNIIDGFWSNTVIATILVQHCYRVVVKHCNSYGSGPIL